MFCLFFPIKLSSFFISKKLSKFSTNNFLQLKMKKKTFCDICKKFIIGGSYKFKSHLYQHKAVEPRFKCTYCSREFFRCDAFSRHVKMHTGAVRNEKKYVCDYCDRSFVKKRNLIIHLDIHDEHSNSRYKCLACGITYCEERLLKYHIRKTHFNLQQKESNHVKKQLNETWIERVNESAVCVQMTKINNNVITIKKLNDIKTESKIELEEAGNKTEFKEYITSVFAHLDKSQYSKATCDYCNKEMLKKSLLSHIRERHLKLRRFECGKCGQTFKRHYQMVDHVCGRERRRRNK